jgi:hypothetical protein
MWKLYYPCHASSREMAVVSNIAVTAVTAAIVTDTLFEVALLMSCIKESISRSALTLGDLDYDI